MEDKPELTPEEERDLEYFGEKMERALKEPEESEEDTGERVVVTPSGRLTKEALPPDTDVLADPEDIPVTYDEAPGDEIDPELLQQYYEMVKAQQAMARPRRFVAKSVNTKKQHDKAKRNSRNKMAKKSRKKNRKK